MALAIRGLLIALLGLLCLHAQQYVISTVAGGAPIPTPTGGTEVSINFPRGGVADSSGNMYFSTLNCVFKLDANGVMTLVAGNSRGGFSGDGVPATSAQLYQPWGLTLDARRNLYIADSVNARVRMVSPAGIITTVAGNGVPGASGDGGPAVNAQLVSPQSVAADDAGNLYVGDRGSRLAIRKVSPSGVISTVSGVYIPNVSGLAVDAAGNLYASDYSNSLVFKRSVAGAVTIFGATPANDYPCGCDGDGGPATGAQFLNPGGLAVDGAGNLYIADEGHHRIRMVSTSGTITSVAGGYGGDGYSGDGGPATSASFLVPSAISLVGDGSYYILDTGDSRIRKVSAAGIITTVAGNGNYLFSSGDGGPATSAQIDAPLGVAVDAGGNLYLSEQSNRIRKVSNGGTISTVAGSDVTGYSGDGGLATDAEINRPWGVAVSAGGAIYIADWNNAVVRRVTTNGIISTVAGSATLIAGSSDGVPATSEDIGNPVSVAVDGAGNFYIAGGQFRLREVSPTGIITTLAGTGWEGNSGDGGPAISAMIDAAQGMAIDAGGNFYLSFDSGRVRKITAAGIITTIVGTGVEGYAGDGSVATNAELNHPGGVAVDADGNLYIADQENHRIRKVSTSGIISTIAGNGTPGYSGDGGPAASGQLYAPIDVAVDSVGNIYIADLGNNAIRMLTPSLPACTYSLSSNALRSPVAGGNLTLAIATGPACPWAISNLPDWITIPGSSSGSGSASVTLAVAPNTVASRTAQIFVVATTVSVAQGSSTLVVSAGGVVNAASYMRPMAPGSIAAVFGNFLPPISSATLSVQFGAGAAVPLLYTSPGQLDVQIPWELAGQSQATITATSNGQVSAPQTVNIATYAPAIFSMNGQGTGQGAIVDATGRLLDWSNPAIGGSTIAQIYCTGLGPVTNTPLTGAPSPENPLAQTTTVPKVTFGGLPAQVLFSGLAPGFVGLYQVNALVPPDEWGVNEQPVVISIGGVQSNMVTIAAQ